MKVTSSGKTRRRHLYGRSKKKKKKKKKKKYVKFPKFLKKPRKTVLEKSQNELESITSTTINCPMSDE